MAISDQGNEPLTLRRWLHRKRDAAAVGTVPADHNSATPVAATTPALPPVESLTFDSNFAPFVRPDVDAALRRLALRKLFADPKLNATDGLDVYAGDYTAFEPLAPELLATLAHARGAVAVPRVDVTPGPSEETAAGRSSPSSESMPIAEEVVDQPADTGSAASMTSPARKAQHGDASSATDPTPLAGSPPSGHPSPERADPAA